MSIFHRTHPEDTGNVAVAVRSADTISDTREAHRRASLPGHSTS